MAVRFREVEALVTQGRIDFAVRFAQFLSAPVSGTNRVDPFQNCIESGIADPEAIVVNPGHGSRRLRGTESTQSMVSESLT